MMRGWLRRACSFPVFLGALLVVGVTVCALRNPADPDAWWHVATGNLILQTGTFPETDPFSFTAVGTSWIAYEWLGEVAMAAAERFGNLQGRTALLLLWSALLFVLLYWYSYLRSQNWKAAFVACAVLLPIGSVFLTLRPQLLGYSFLLLTLICLELFRGRNSKAIWALPLIFLVWVNTHGTFAFGMAAAAIYWICGLKSLQIGGVSTDAWPAAQRTRFEAVILLSVAALAVTPYGPRPATYPLEMALLQPANISNIIEWQPTSSELILGKMFFALLVLYFVCQVVLRQRYQAHELGLLLFAVYSAVQHRRFLLFFAIVFAPLLASLSAHWMRPYRPAKDMPLLNAALISVAVVAVVSLFPSERELERRVTETYPTRALKFLRENQPPGALWNEYAWGGYMIWARQPVFIDGRADIYEYAGILPDYIRIVRAEPSASRLLRRHDIRASLVRASSPLSTVLDTAPGWRAVHRDPVSVVYFYEQPFHSPNAVRDSRSRRERLLPANTNMQQTVFETVAKR
jgi:hypothetical protein